MIYGRERERAQLRELLDDAMAGHGSLVLVSGEAGIGKTTLVDDLVQDARHRGCLVLIGGCYDLTTTPPYEPWIEALAGYEPAGELPSVPAWIRNIEEFQKLGGQASLFEEARRFLAGLASHRHLVLVLEDLHWTDGASLEMLRFMARRLAGVPILIVATYRDDEVTRRHSLAQLLPALVREAGAIRISVQRLASTDLRAMISGAVRLDEADDEQFAAYVANLADGNPLYAVELLHHLRNTGIIRVENGRNVVGNLDAADVSPLLLQLIERRLALLDDEVVGLLEVAAVIGQEFPFELWAGVSDSDEGVLLRALDAVLDQGVLEEFGRTGKYRFRHALIREALYQQQIWPRRRARHLRIAEALMREGRSAPDSIVYHLEAAGDERAVEWLVRAGYRAERAYAWGDAVDRFERALHNIESDPNQTRERGWLSYRIGCLLRFSNPRRGLDYFDEAHAIAAVARDLTLLACAQYGRGVLRNSTINFEAGLQQMAAGIHALEGLPTAERARVNRAGVFSPNALPSELRYSPDELRLPNSPDSGAVPGMPQRLRRDLIRRAVIATMLLQPGRLVEAREWIEPFLGGLELLDRNDAEEIFILCGAAAMLYSLCGRPDLAAPMFPAIWDRHDRDVPLYDAAGVGFMLDYMHLPYQTDALSDRKRAVFIIEEMAARADDMLAPGLTPRHQLSSLYLITGDWDEVVRDASVSNIDRGRKSSAQKFRAAYGAVSLRQGNVERFHDQLVRILPQGPETKPGEILLLAALTLQHDAAMRAVEEGEFEAARSWLEARDRWIAFSGAVSWRADGELGWANYHRTRGDLDLARKHAGQALALASDPRQPLALIAAERFLGQLDVDEECFEVAAEHLQSSIALAERCDAPFEQSLTVVVMAEQAAKLGEVGEARKLIARARRNCEPLGAQPTLERIDKIEALLPRVRRSTGEHPFGLTGREVEVLRLVARGMTDAEAAEELFISPRTASQHLRSIYNKLAVNNRAEATRVAVEQGIV